MKLQAIITIPNISPETLEHAQHVLNEDTKYRDYMIEVVQLADNEDA